MEENGTPRKLILYAVAGGVVAVVLSAAAGYWYYQSTVSEDGEEETEEERIKREKIEELLEREAETNEELIAKLTASKHLQDPRVAQAFLEVDRANFVVEGNPYHDAASPIGFNATISAPHIVSFMLSLIAEKIPKENARILDVGSGSGFTAACLASMAGETGIVYGIDHIEELVEVAKENISKENGDLHQRIRLQAGDGLQGFEAGGPYHVIHVAAAAEEVPQELVDQLMPGGRMVIPVGPSKGFQKLVQVDVSEDGSTVRAITLMDVRFVPMLSKKKQLSGKHKNKVQVLEGNDGERLLVRAELHHAPDTNFEEIKLVRSQWKKERVEGEKGSEKEKEKEEGGTENEKEKEKGGEQS